MIDECYSGKHRKIEGIKVGEGSRPNYPVKRGFLKREDILRPCFREEWRVKWQLQYQQFQFLILFLQAKRE